MRMPSMVAISGEVVATPASMVKGMVCLPPSLFQQISDLNAILSFESCASNGEETGATARSQRHYHHHILCFYIYQHLKSVSLTFLQNQ